MFKGYIHGFPLMLLSGIRNTEATEKFVPYVLISPTYSKLVCFGWIDKDGVQPNFFIALLHKHQFTDRRGNQSVSHGKELNENTRKQH